MTGTVTGAGRQVLVTGASSGTGRATATRFAAAGDHVFATVRSATDARAIERPGITPVLMDVTDPDHIRDCAETIKASVTGLDVLVNNAGIGMTAPLEFIPLESLRSIYEVNVIGQVAVTQAMLPLLRAAHGTIVMIGSVGDRITIPFGGALTSSKHALRSLSDALRMELAPWNIRVVLIEPGSIRTAAVDKTVTDDPQGVLDGLSPDANQLYGAAYAEMTRRFRESEQSGDPPMVVADAILRAARSSRPNASYLVGKGARRMATAARLPTAVLDRARRRLFGQPAPGSAISDTSVEDQTF